MDPRRSPQRIGNAHLADKLAYLRRYSWSATTAPRLPPPVRSEPGAVPFNHGLRLHDRQGAEHIRSQTIQAGEYQTVNVEVLQSLPNKGEFPCTCRGARSKRPPAPRRRPVSPSCRLPTSAALHRDQLRGVQRKSPRDRRSLNLGMLFSTKCSVLTNPPRNGPAISITLGVSPPMSQAARGVRR
jgi:hypothetical protein